MPKVFSVLSNEDLERLSEIVYEDSVLEIARVDNNSPETIIVFSCAKARCAPAADFPAYRRSDRNIIYIVDKQNSWFNNFSAEFVLSKIKDIILNKKIFLYGSSMGGFNAIHFSNFVESELCLAMCPQYSIDGDLYGVQASTVGMIERLSQKDLHTVKFSPTTKYILVFGNDAEEVRSYSKMVPECIENNISFDYTIFQDSPHNVPQFLSENALGRGYLVTESFINNSMEDAMLMYSSLMTIKL